MGAQQVATGTATVVVQSACYLPALVSARSGASSWVPGFMHLTCVGARCDVSDVIVNVMMCSAGRRFDFPSRGRP